MRDPQLLGGITSGVLFVVRAGATPCAHVHRAIACLDADRVIGTVLNGVASENIGSISAS
jgi:Mrp family chromosome partitioning ATPase